MSFVTIGSAAVPKLRNGETYEGLGLADPAVRFRLVRYMVK
jgi:hypothetical protein